MKTLNLKEIVDKLDRNTISRIEDYFDVCTAKDKVLYVMLGEGEDNKVYLHYIKKKIDFINKEVGHKILKVKVLPVKMDEVGFAQALMECIYTKNSCGFIILADYNQTKTKLDGLTSFRSSKCSRLDLDCFLGEEVCYPCTTPCTVEAISEAISSATSDIVGKHIVIVNRSETIGRPLAKLLLDQNMTVTVCHSHTTNLKELTKNADMVVFGCNQPNMAKTDWFKDGAVVIDISTNYDENGHLVGDVDMESIKDKDITYTNRIGGITTSILLNRIKL